MPDVTIRSFKPTDPQSAPALGARGEGSPSFIHRFRAGQRIPDRLRCPTPATSWPNSSVTAVTRAPIVASMTHHTTHEAANTNAPMARMPVICTSKSPPPAMQTASVPQIPANRCAGIAPDDVVDLEPVEELDADDDNGAADPADHHRPVVLDDVGPRSDRHQPADRAVQARKQVDAPQNRPRQRHRGDHARGRREIGVGEDIADGHGIRGAAERQLGTAVEPEPAHPEYEHAERHGGHVGRRGGLHAAVLAVLAPPRADDQRASERRPAAGGVDDRRPGKIPGSPSH